MHAITGITGQVGGAAARELLSRGQRVRAVVRDADKGRAWAALGCEVAIATMDDAAALVRAFDGATSVFVVPPPVFDPAPGFPEARATATALDQALRAARPARVVCLSTIGAQAAQPNLLSQHTLMEEVWSALPLDVTLLRPSWFIENLRWDVDAARVQGVIPAFLQPLDRPVPMVATEDVGRAAARLLMEPGAGQRIVELDGPAPVSPNDIAAALAQALGRPVRAQPVPRDSWEALFRSQGMRHPEPRIRMIDGFNEGWIRFAGGEAVQVRGTTGLAGVVDQLVG
jgi:NAD(P)H dehydrogenase (quinone)